ncbi:MAG: hypothetical protein K0Q65_1678, partial [Clostridia bacterium]|nr:hypothetical protein [Clostridia bacterium]
LSITYFTSNAGKEIKIIGIWGGRHDILQHYN